MEQKKQSAFCCAQRRMGREFEAEMAKFGLAVKHSVSCRYENDDQWVVGYETEPAPVRGNRERIEQLRAAGYHVLALTPYNWQRRRGYVVQTWRRLEITQADEKEALA